MPIERVNEQAIYERDNYTCVYCGATEHLTLDHVIPLVRGGPHREDNLAVACMSYNCSKQDKLPIEWLGWIYTKNGYHGRAGMYYYICPWCINKDRESCSGCAAEGRFRFLEPETLWNWEHFELPPFRELLEMNGPAKLAVLWLALYYLQQKEQQNP